MHYSIPGEEREQSPEQVDPTASTVVDQELEVAPSLHTDETLKDENLTAPRLSNWPPVQPQYRRREQLPLWVRLLTVGVSLLLILGGFSVLIFNTSTGYTYTLRSSATAAAQATRNVDSTTQAQQQGTVQALNTAQANIDATATAQANTDSQATATINDATATATAMNALYQQMTEGTPVLNDTLTDQASSKGKWDKGQSSANTGCIYNNNTYHAMEGQQGYLQPCIAQAQQFSDFTYEAQVTINQGLQGQAGLLFRIDSSNTSFYFFHIGLDGSYALDLVTPTGHTTLTSGTSSALQIGSNQSNQLGIVTQGTTFSLFANGQYVDTASDSTLSTGKVGVGVVDSNTPIDAEFSNARVWQPGSSPSTNVTPSPTIPGGIIPTTTPGPGTHRYSAPLGQ